LTHSTVTPRRIATAILGLLPGVALGGAAGLFGGLIYTSIAETSGFEGHLGFVVVFWLLAGAVFGSIVGVISGLWWPQRS
jgi:hypothetical protein